MLISHFFKKIGSSFVSKDIISSHNVHSKLECSMRCLKESKCVGYNWRKTKSNKYAVNCQLSNKTKESESSESGEWMFYQDTNNVSDLQLTCNADGRAILGYCEFVWLQGLVEGSTPLPMHYLHFYFVVLKNVQWRSQPENLVPLCKFQIIIIIHFFRNWLFSQSMSTKIFA